LQFLSHVGCLCSNSFNTNEGEKSYAELAKGFDRLDCPARNSHLAGGPPTAASSRPFTRRLQGSSAREKTI